MTARKMPKVENGLQELGDDLGQWGQWPESERKEMKIAQLYATWEAERGER